MSATQTIRVVRPVSGSSLKVGQTYLVFRREQGRGFKADAFFSARRIQYGTHVRDWRVTLGLLTGALQVVA